MSAMDAARLAAKEKQAPEPDSVTPAAIRDTFKVMVSTITDLADQGDLVSLVQAMGYAMSFSAHLLTKTEILMGDSQTTYTKLPYDHKVDEPQSMLRMSALRSRYLEAGSDALNVVDVIYNQMIQTHEANRGDA